MGVPGHVLATVSTEAIKLHPMFTWLRYGDDRLSLGSFQRNNIIRLDMPSIKRPIKRCVPRRIARLRFSWRGVKFGRERDEGIGEEVRATGDRVGGFSVEGDDLDGVG